MHWSEAEYQHYLLRRPQSGASRSGATQTSALPEKQFMAAMIREARLAGWIAYHTFDSRKSPEGFPDVILVRPEPGRGPVLALELKTARGKLTMPQQLWLTALHGKTIRARVVRPADFEDLMRMLQAP